MYVIEQSVSEQRGMIYTGVYPPPDKHLKCLGPVTAIPFRAFFFFFVGDVVFQQYMTTLSVATKLAQCRACP